MRHTNPLSVIRQQSSRRRAFMYRDETLYFYLNYNEDENWHAQIYFSSLRVKQVI
jgi:hypothetical protein